MKNNSKSIAVTGASGFVAKALRKKILMAGYNLTSFSRNNFASFKNETKIITNYNDVSKLASNLKKCDILIHLIGVGKQDASSSYNDVNLQITLALVKACKTAKIKQIIYLSGLGVSSKNTSSYFISKYRAEQAIINSKLTHTIFRPSYIIGKDDYLTKSIKAQIKQKRILILGTGKYPIQPISISDATDIIIESFYNKRFSNKIIDLVGPQKIIFEKYIKLFLHANNNNNNNAKHIDISKLSIQECIRNALTNINYVYSLDDINILLGEFVGDYKRLSKISKHRIKSIDSLF